MGLDAGWEKVLLAKGLIEAPPPTVLVEEKPKFVTAAYRPIMTWLLPIETASETNQREWRSRSHRTRRAREIILKAFAPYWMLWGPLGDLYRAGLPVRCELTRLGGRALDRTANLGPALKATEDAITALLGINDGNPLWKCSVDQEPGGLCGVRIQFAAG
jgi:hypothetical protein